MVSSPSESTSKYCPFYCEENVWWQCRSAVEAARDAYAVFVSNRSRSVALWRQRTGQGEAGLTIWDYHAVFLMNVGEKVDGGSPGSWIVRDLDSTLGPELSAHKYLSGTFPRRPEPIDAQFLPLFHVVPAALFVREFSSDRRHMLDESGRWRRSPPAWDLIQTSKAASGAVEGTEHNLEEFVDMTGTTQAGRLGSIHTYEGMLARFGLS